MTLYASLFTDYLCFTLPLFYAQICSTAILTPLVEEFAKVYPLFYRHGETERSIFNLGFLVGFGFGITEFFLYTFLLGVPFYLRLFGILFHASSTSIAAYGTAKKRIIPFYLLAVALHFANNFIAVIGSLNYLLVIINVGTYYLSYYLYRGTSEKIVN